MIYKTEDILKSIKVRSLAPISQGTFQNADLILLANEEQLISLVPDIQKVKENYFLRSVVVPIESGDPEITVPERAIAGGLRGVFLKNGTNRTRLSQMKISDLEFGSGSGQASMFFMQDNKIVLYPTPSSANDSLEIWYYSRPSDLVLTTECGKIDVITPDVSTIVFDLDTDLSSSMVVGSNVDIISAKSPNRIQAFNAVIQSITGVTVTLLLSDCIDANETVRPEVGDYLCVAGKTNIPQLPVELHPILCQMVAARLVEALGDTAKLQLVNAKLAEMRGQAMSLLANRVENEPIALKNNYSILASVKSGWGFGRGRF